MNAFVSTPILRHGSTSFNGQAIDTRHPKIVANIRMATGEKTDSKESPVFGKAGNSMWKENGFTGGFPGGEAFYRAWIEEGMTKDVPDVPESMQSKNEFKPSKKSKTGVLALLDQTEFFKGFSGGAAKSEEGEDEAEGTVEDESQKLIYPKPEDSEAPDPSLYEAYFPQSRLNIAPDIKIIYEKNFLRDRVSLAMTEVTASASDVYYPKEMKNKAPMIEISYNGSSLAGASIKVSLDYVKNLPTLAPPPKTGEARVELVPGRGGGLKLEYKVAGEGVVNI